MGEFGFLVRSCGNVTVGNCTADSRCFLYRDSVFIGTFTDPISSRGQTFFGRASECVSEALMCHSERSDDDLSESADSGNRSHAELESPRPMLTPSGLMAVPVSGLPEAVRITEADLMDAPAFAGGSLHGVPSMMILSATVAGWRPGQTVDVEYKNIRVRGIVKERSVDADTGDGAWKCELLCEVVSG